MRRIALRFRAEPRTTLLGHATGAGQRLAALALAGLCLFALLGVLWRAISAQHDLDRARQSLIARQAASTGSTAPPLPSTLLAPRRVQALNQAIGQLNAPWSDIFDALEDRTSPTVALISIEPDANKGSVRIEAESKSLRNLLEYANGMGESDRFRQTALVRHEVNERDPASPVRLTIEAFLVRRASAPGVSAR